MAPIMATTTATRAATAAAGSHSTAAVLVESMTAAEQLNLALALSLADPPPRPATTNVSHAAAVTSAGQSRTAAMVPVPPRIADLLEMSNYKDLRRYGRKLGVQLILHRANSEAADTDDGDNVEVKAENSDALEIARTLLSAAFSGEPVLDGGKTLEADIAARRNEIVHVFVDNSNLFLGAQWLKMEAQGDSSEAAGLHRDIRIRVLPFRLHDVVCDSRTPGELVTFGSAPPSNNHIWQVWRNTGYAVHISQRASSTSADGAAGIMREQFVDDALIAQIEHSLLNYRGSEGNRRTLALVTGDGNDNGGRASFLSCVDHAIGQGWNVEIYAWRNSCSKHYIELERVYSDTGRYRLIYLDQHRELLTFVKGVTPQRVPVSTSDNAVGHGYREDSDQHQHCHHLHHHHRHHHQQQQQQQVQLHIGLHDEDEDEDWMNDPISMAPIQDPVTFAWLPGVHFDRNVIERWLATEHTCPYTRRQANASDLIPANGDFVSRLAAWREMHTNGSATSDTSSDSSDDVAESDIVNANDSTTNHARRPCRHGNDCRFLQQGTCTFYHTPQQVAAARRENGRCVHGAACRYLRRGVCRFLHTREEIHEVASQGN